MVKLKLIEDLKVLCCGEIIKIGSEIKFRGYFISPNRVLINYNFGAHKVKFSSLRRCTGYINDKSFDIDGDL